MGGKGRGGHHGDAEWVEGKRNVGGMTAVAQQLGSTPSPRFPSAIPVHSADGNPAISPPSDFPAPSVPEPNTFPGLYAVA